MFRMLIKLVEPNYTSYKYTYGRTLIFHRCQLLPITAYLPLLNHPNMTETLYCVYSLLLDIKSDAGNIQAVRIHVIIRLNNSTQKKKKSLKLLLHSWPLTNDSLSQMSLYVIMFKIKSRDSSCT